MGMREWLTDYSKGDNLALYWKIFGARERAKSRFFQDVLNLICSRMAHRHGGYIGRGAVLEGIPSLPHGLHGVYISRFAKIGKGCRIYQNVTIGEKGRKAPTIGDNCLIGAGAVLLGDIRIGAGAKIGAGAVVCRDVPAGATAVSKQAYSVEKEGEQRRASLSIRERKEKRESALADGTEAPAQAGITQRARAWIELDADALRYNVRALQGRLPAGCRLMPAVKADAYGHGAVWIAKQLAGAGVDAFCVACAQEGEQLRRCGIEGEILILGYTPPQQLERLARYGLTQTVVDFSYAEMLRESGMRLHVHVGVDTGMHRLGERWENMENIFRIFEMENLTVDGLFTHLCVADSARIEDREYTKKQAEAFFSVAGRIQRRFGYRPKLHLLSSAGIFACPEYAADFVRPGIALYGAYGNGILRPVLSLKAYVACVQTLHDGETAGYGRAFTADGERRIAVLSIGYADGLPSALSEGKGWVLLGGKRAPIAGRVCMDQTLVDVTGIDSVQAGDVAVLIGRDGREEITAGEMAGWAHTIPNDILSRLGSRLERLPVG